MNIIFVFIPQRIPSVAGLKIWLCPSANKGLCKIESLPDGVQGPLSADGLCPFGVSSLVGKALGPWWP